MFFSRYDSKTKRAERTYPNILRLTWYCASDCWSTL
jgi:hypothetical protein